MPNHKLKKKPFQTAHHIACANFVLRGAGLQVVAKFQHLRHRLFAQGGTGVRQELDFL
jgi:hypothetical protein